MKAALLVVDMQKEFFQNEKCKDSLMEALEYVNYSIGVFRKAESPVIFIQDKETSEAGYDIFDDVEVQENDVKVSKLYSNSFWETALEELLNKLEVKLVVICGFAAEHCIHATYNGAMERGFDVALLQHGVASSNQNYAEFIQNICSTTSINTLEYFLKINDNQ